MATNALSGQVIEVCPKKTGVSRATGNTWASQDFVIETGEKYPRKVCFQLWGEDKIAKYIPRVGDKVDVSYEIESRKFKGTWYSTIKAWKVDGPKNYAQDPQKPVREPEREPQPRTDPAPTAPPPSQNYSADDDDDLPF